MTNEEIKQIWHSVYGRSGNFITPVTVGYFEIGDHICEISRGSSNNFSDSLSEAYNKLHGVTVITKVHGNRYRRNDDLSQCFESYEEAVDYINNLYLDTDVKYCNAIEVNEETVLINGKIVQCVEDYKEDDCTYSDVHCRDCYFHDTRACHKVKCMTNMREDNIDVYFKVIGNEYSTKR